MLELPARALRPSAPPLPSEAPALSPCAVSPSCPLPVFTHRLCLRARRLCVRVGDAGAVLSCRPGWLPERRCPSGPPRPLPPQGPRPTRHVGGPRPGFSSSATLARTLTAASCSVCGGRWPSNCWPSNRLEGLRGPASTHIQRPIQGPPACSVRGREPSRATSLPCPRPGSLSWHSASRSSLSTASRGALPCRVLLPALQPPCPCQGLGVWGDVEWLLFLMSPCSAASSVAPRAVPPVGAGCAHCPAVGQLPPAFPLSQLPEPLRHPPGGSQGIQATLPVTPLWFPTSRIGAVLMRPWSPGPRLAALQHARRGAGVLGVWRPLLWGGPGPGFGLSGRGSSNGRKCGARLTSDGGFRGLCGVF